MKSKITYEKTSEQEELEKKLAELSALQAELTERELELVTLQGELHAFEREYLQVIGTRYAELHQLKNKAINAKQEDRDLLAEMASKIDKQIAKAKIKLEKLKSKFTA
jgi:predicted  nucleic acid-binding Zn-ribbon protein